MRNRPTFLRTILAVLGMIVLGAVAYVGLGWALWTNQHWLITSRLGYERINYLDCAYMRALAAVLPKDSDGDGFPDGLEAYRKCGPYDPASGPETHIRIVPNFQAYNADPARLSHPDISLEPGERRLVRARLCIYDQRGVFSPNMQVLLSQNPNAPGRLSLPGGTLSKEPLLVPVAADGSMEFELSLQPETYASNPSADVSIEVVNTATKLPVGQIFYGGAWKLPPVACTVKDLPDDKHGWRQVRLQWPEARGSGVQFIEATRDWAGKEWFLVGPVASTYTAASVSYLLDNVDPRFRGPLKFRVVPTSATASAK